MTSLADQVAVVTGGSRGIGEGIVRALVAEGAQVAFNGRTRETGDGLVQALGADRAWFCQGSVMDTADIQALIDGAVQRFGRLDILVNNAGGDAGALHPVAELDEYGWEQTLRYNLTSTFLATKAALRHMLPAGYGTIVNMSSVEGKIGQAGIAAYVTAKHGVNGFTKSTAAEVGRAGITVNAICPGAIMTDALVSGGRDLAENLGMSFDEMVETVFRSKTHTGELATVEQVSAMVVFLAGPAGRGITGAQLSIDGGIAPY